MNKRILFDTLKSQKNIFYARIGAELAAIERIARSPETETTWA